MSQEAVLELFDGQPAFTVPKSCSVLREHYAKFSLQDFRKEKKNCYVQN